MSLKERAVIAVFWDMLERIGGTIVFFVVGIILARILSPADFGLFGMITVFVTVSQVIIDSGFSNALIQKKDLKAIDKSSAFYFNVTLSIAIAGLLCLAAPAIAAFYEEPRLTNITMVMALSLVIGSLGSIHKVLFTKNLNFKSQFKVTFTGRMFSGGLAIWFAYNGHGVWALVYQQVALHGWNMIAFWIVSKWKPGLEFDINSIKKLWSYGSNLLAANLIREISNNIYILIIGKFFSASALGFYTQADRMRKTPSALINASITNVAFPVFSTLQEEKKAFADAVKKALQLMSFINFPIMGLLFVLAEPFITFLLTDKWLPSVPYFEIMCIIAFFFPLNLTNVMAIMAKGRSDLNLKLGLVKNSLRIINVIIMYRFGIIYIVWGELALSCIAYLINTFYAKRVIFYGFQQQFMCLLPTLLITLAMIGGMLSFRFFHVDLVFVKIALQVFTGSAIYLLLHYVFKTEALGAMKDTAIVFLDKLHKRKNNGK